ncbi:uncharacterized protein DS421_13g422280 [Arachis hypogaea]|nr:uncharacterized protein DS421_13g422280 [Arachis hypogaea]
MASIDAKRATHLEMVGSERKRSRRLTYHLRSGCSVAELSPSSMASTFSLLTKMRLIFYAETLDFHFVSLSNFIKL